MDSDAYCSRRQKYTKYQRHPTTVECIDLLCSAALQSETALHVHGTNQKPAPDQNRSALWNGGCHISMLVTQSESSLVLQNGTESSNSHFTSMFPLFYGFAKQDAWMFGCERVTVSSARTKSSIYYRSDVTLELYWVYSLVWWSINRHIHYSINVPYIHNNPLK